MTSTGFIFFILKWFEFLMLFLSGKQLESTKTRKDYWRVAIIPIVVFALVEGLRWGRLIDWNNAVVEYSELDSFITARHLSNPIYTIVLYSLKCLGLSYPVFVVLQCGFLYYSSLFLLQDYKKYLRWILPCLLMAFVNNENFIRFYFSLGFLFIAIYYYIHESLKKYILFGVLSALTHYAQLPFLLILPCLKFLNKRQIPKNLCIIIYLGGLFFVNISQLDFLVKISNSIISLLGMESEYRLFNALNNMEDIINGTAYGTEGHLFVRSLSYKITNALLYVPLIIMASSCLKKETNGNLIYNLTVINLILTPILGQAELLNRFTLSFNIFVAISFGAVIINYIHRKNTCILVYLMLFLYFYAFINAPFVREDYMMYFLWDSNGAATNLTPYL